MKKSMKKGIILTLAAMLSLPLFACASGGDTSDTAPSNIASVQQDSTSSTDKEEKTDSAEESKVVVFSKKREWEAGWNELKTAYEKQHSGVEIVIDLTDANTYYDILKGYVASDDLPDIIQTVPGTTLDLWKEHLVDISDLKSLGMMDESLVKEYQVDGKYYGVPLFMELHGVIYNMKYLEQVGYEAPPETLDEFIGMNQKLQEAGLPTGISPWKTAGSIVGHMTAPVFSAHEDSLGYMNEIVAGNVDLTQDENWNALFDYLDATMQYGNKDALNTDNTTERNALYAEEYAWYAHDGSWLTPAIKSTNPELETRIRLGVYPFTNDKAKNRIGRSTQSLSIMRSKNDTAAAKDFVDFMLGTDEGCDILVEKCNTVLLRKDYAMTEDQIGALSVQGREYVDAGRSYGNFRYIPDEIAKSLESPLQKFIGGAATKEEALKEIQTAFQSLKK